MPVVSASPYTAAIACLPPGATLRADGVTWEDYAQLLEDTTYGSRARIFYDRGKLEIMSPALRHERAKQTLNRLVATIEEELEIDIVSVGSTTIYEQVKRGGAEPDDSFYVGRIDHILGDRDLDFTRDPPPDLIIEIDHSSGSLNKFPLYARLGVAELWRVVKLRVQIHLLREGRYARVEQSALFPFLSAAVLTDFLRQGMEQGEGRAARDFRIWLRENALNTEQA